MLKPAAWRARRSKAGDSPVGPSLLASVEGDALVRMARHHFGVPLIKVRLVGSGRP